MEITTVATASLRNYRGSARKARLILDMIRGKKVNQAKNILQFSTKKMAKDIHNLLNSAVANATQKAGKVDMETLYVETAFADEGVTQKRMMLAIKGMAYRIRKRSCHITLHLGSSTLPAEPTIVEPKKRKQKNITTTHEEPQEEETSATPATTQEEESTTLSAPTTENNDAPDEVPEVPEAPESVDTTAEVEENNETTPVEPNESKEEEKLGTED